ncbi:MAG: HAD family phosphatase [Candidatus Lokiarchaeota archaeon]|nr:HAD family phosphatase [Candidatus Lokiarchaeota archaeon]
MKVSPIKAIVFDLGDVLIEHSFTRAFLKWSELTQIPQDLFQEGFKYEDPLMERFERGQISAEDFFQHLTQKLNINWAFSEFKQGWLHAIDEVNPESYTLLEKLKARFELHVLSNTNELHAKDILVRFPKLFAYFNRIFFSNELYARKPEKEIYRKMIEQLDMPPEQILFIDDNERNLIGASEFGIQTVQMQSYSQLYISLKNFAII